MIDRILGTFRPAKQELPPGQPGNAIPRLLPAGWQGLAALAGMLVLGVGLGAGALMLINRQNPQAGLTLPGLTASPTTQPSNETKVVPTGTPTITDLAATEEVGTPFANPTSTSTPRVFPTEPTPIVESTANSTPSATLNASRCAVPSNIQFTAIQSGVKILDPAYDIQAGIVVKSIAADNLWFFAAKVISPDLDGGSTVEPGVWAFYEKDNVVIDVYAVNDIAFQYSDFTLGQQANPAIDMQVNGADISYQCASVSQ
jgi:hypothetical protein